MVAVVHDVHIEPGFKRTEVGAIPEDWEMDTLGNCLLGAPQYGINAPAVPYSDSLPTYIRITDITDDGRFSPENIASVRQTGAEMYVLQAGDLVFARTGASVGKSYLYRPADGELVFAGYLIRVKANPARLLPEYLADYVKTDRYWNWVQAMSMRSGQPGINGSEYAQLPILLPPLSEQRAIVRVLGDCDALHATEEKLIAKKRAIKQGTMRELLSGHTRLPGFSGDWEVKRLGDMTDSVAGGTPSTLIREYWGGDIKWMSSGELHTKRVYDVEGRITTEGLKNSSTRLIPPHCVLIGLAGQGKTRGTVAMNLVELCTNQSIAAVLPSPQFVPDYLYFNLDSRYEELRNLSTGEGGRGGLNLGIINSLAIPLPSLAEQAAIANVLSDMDAEIAALEQRRNKTQAVKQGVMQELLMGRRRLV